MTAAFVTITRERLEDIAATLLQAGGYTGDEARITAQSLVLSDLSGHESHGVIRVAEYLYALKKGEVVSNAALEIISESANGLLADAGAGLGQVQMPRLLDRLLEKARNNAVASGALRNCGHIGRLGEWAEIIAAAGFAGLVMANDNGALQVVAPPGAKQPCTSTNPIAFGLPLDSGDNFLFDFSTSAVAIGKMRLAYLAGTACGENLLQDAEGQTTTDPSVLFRDPKGAILPMGGLQGYKGFGLSMIVDFLAAGLSGGFTPPAPEGTPVMNNALVTVWNPGWFGGLDHFQEQARKYISYIQTLAPAGPETPVRIPGVRSRKEREARERNGIPVSVATCRTLARSAEITGVSPSAEEFLETLKI